MIKVRQDNQLPKKAISGKNGLTRRQITGKFLGFPFMAI
jgi:hypothetical protein